MKKLFIDTNIVIDLLAKRPGFYASAAKLFTLADQGKIELSVSSLTFANTHYVVVKQEGKEKAVQILRDLELIVTIIDLTGKIVRLALNDKGFKDFEDGLQYYSALENGMEVIITRNLKDFKHAKLPVMSADQFLKTIK
jgi:predicted nucleic acid-binding protein